MEDTERKETIEQTLERIERDLLSYEKILMRTNIILGDQYYDRYQNRMGFEKDGSVTKDGVVIWPERMVE